jgi:hypothetical protein
MSFPSIPRTRGEAQTRLHAVEQLSSPPQAARVAELVRWSVYLDPGSVSTGAQRASAVDVLANLAEHPDDLRAAWLAALQGVRRGTITRSVVALLADALASDAGAPRSKAS